MSCAGSAAPDEWKAVTTVKVHELIEKLQEFDGDLEVEFSYTYSSGCCSWNSSYDSEERNVGEVNLAEQRVSRWMRGPRGGKEAWRTVTENVVRLSE